MSDYLDSQRGWMPPILDANAPGQYQPQTLADTGTTESSNSRPFSKDRLHVISVGATAVRVGFSRTGGSSNVVPPTGGFVIPANSFFTFRALDSGQWGALFVYVEAADGSSAYEISIQQRVP